MADFTIEGIDGLTPTSSSAASSDPFGPSPAGSTTGPKPMTLEAAAVPPGIIQAAATPAAPVTDISAAPTTPSGITSSTTPAATIPTELPDISTMQNSLEKSGALLADLKVAEVKPLDTSPLAALQPGSLQQTPETLIAGLPSVDQMSQMITPVTLSAQPLPTPHSIALANSGLPINANPNVNIKEDHPFPFFVLLGVPLLLLCMQGLVQLAHYAMVRYPQYEELVILNQLTRSELNVYNLRALGLGVLVLLGICQLLYLCIKNLSLSTLSFLATVVLIIANIGMQNIVTQPYFASGNPLHLPKIINEISAGPSQLPNPTLQQMMAPEMSQSGMFDEQPF